jgi:hypothetical protein
MTLRDWLYFSAELLAWFSVFPVMALFIHLMGGF